MITKKINNNIITILSITPLVFSASMLRSFGIEFETKLRYYDDVAFAFIDCICVIVVLFCLFVHQS